MKNIKTKGEKTKVKQKDPRECHLGSHEDVKIEIR